jgi:hypothetical protein
LTIPAYCYVLSAVNIVLDELQESVVDIVLDELQEKCYELFSCIKICWLIVQVKEAEKHVKKILQKKVILPEVLDTILGIDDFSC